MALDGFTIGSGAPSGGAPAASPAVPTPSVSSPGDGSALKGFSIGATAPTPSPSSTGTTSAPSGGPSLAPTPSAPPTPVTPKNTGNMFSGFMNFAGKALSSASTAISKATTAPTEDKLPGGGTSGGKNTLAYLPSELARAIPGVADLQDDTPTPGASAPGFYSTVIAPKEASLTKQKAQLDALAKTTNPRDSAAVDKYNAAVASYNATYAGYQRNFKEYQTAATSDKTNSTEGKQQNLGIAHYITASDMPGNVSTALGETAKNIASMPIKAAADVWDAGRTFLGKAPNASFNVPVIGKVTSDVYDVVDRINNGQDPVSAALAAGGSSIFNVLFFADIANRVGGARITKTGEYKGDFNDIQPGVVDAPAPKTGRLYEPNVAYNKGGAQVLSPEALSKMKEQGVPFGKNYDPESPTFFRVTQGKGGAYTAEVMQLKPSYIETAFNKLFGTKEGPANIPSMLGLAGAAKVEETHPAEMKQIASEATAKDVEPIHTATVKEGDVTDAMRTQIQDAAPAENTPAPTSQTVMPFIPVSHTVVHNMLRLGGGDVADAGAGAAVLNTEIQKHLQEEGELVTHAALMEKLGVDAHTATELVNQARPKPTLPVQPKALKNFETNHGTLESMNPKQPTKLSNEEAAPMANQAAQTYWDQKIQTAIEQGKPIVIGGDDLKDYFGNDYNDNNHPVYSQAANVLFDRALKETDGDVVFTGGGPGSGKTELLVNHMKDEGFTGIIYDSNFSNLEGAKVQIEKARAAGKEVRIYGVLPNLEKSRGFTIMREGTTGRGITDNTFAHGHSSFPAVVKALLEEGIVTPSEVKLFDTREVHELHVAKELVANGGHAADPLAILNNLAYNKDEIKTRYAKENYDKEGNYLGSTGREFQNSEVREAPSGAPEENRADKEVASYAPMRGFINPGAIAEPVIDAAKQVGDYIEHAEKTTELTGTVNDAIYQHEGNRKAMRQRAIQLLQAKGSELSAEQWEKLYHYDENPKGETLTKDEMNVYKDVIAPLREALTKARAEYRTMGGHITEDLQGEMTPRYAKEKGGPIDKALEQIKKKTKEAVSVANGGLLSKSVGSGAKHRIFHVAIDENGKRTVISTKNGRVTAFTDNKMSDLGAFNSTPKHSLLRDQVEPIIKRLSNLKKELDTLRSVKVGTTGVEARLANLEDQALSISVDLMNSSDLEDAKAVQKSKVKLRALLHDIRLLAKVKPADDIVLRQQRIETLEKKMVEASQQLLDVQGTVPADELHDRVFVDKNGNTHTIDQATTREIEANTKTRYHKNVLANYVLAFDRTNNALSALKLLERIQNTPEFGDIIVKENPDVAPPEGWKLLTMPQFRGYYAEPKLWEALEDLSNRLKGREPFPVVDEINNLLTSLIVLNPIMHFPNVLQGWATAEAADGKIPGISKNSAKNFARAFNAVKNKDALYLSYLEHGAPLMAIKNTAADFTKAVLEQYSEEVERDPTQWEALSKKLGYANPAVWFKGLMHVNETATWGGNDIMFLHAILDAAERNGSTPEEAIALVSKRMADYRMPSRIGPGKFGRAISKFAQGRGLLFARYHYSGVIKPWIESIGDAAGPKSSWKQRREGLRALTYLGLMSLLVYPFIDKLLRGLTGNPLTYISDAGPTKLVQNVEKYAAVGAPGTPAFLASMFTPSPAVTAMIELGFNVDLYTRNPIYSNPQNEGLGGFTTSIISPLATGSRMTPGDFALSLLGIYSPKNAQGKNALNAQKYDELPLLQSQVKKDLAAGKVDKANAEMKDFNDRAIANYNADMLAQGKKPLAADGSENAAFLKVWGIKTPGTKAISDTAKLYGDGSLTSKSSLVDRVATYAKALSIDPVEVFKLAFTGQTIARVDAFKPFSDSSAIIVQRMSLSQSSQIKQAKEAAGGDANGNGLQLDHIIPLEAGGTNDASNLNLITTQQDGGDQQKLEDLLGKAVKNGDVSRAMVREYVIRFKASQPGETLPDAMIREYQSKYGSQPITLQQVVDALNSKKK